MGLGSRGRDGVRGGSQQVGGRRQVNDVGRDVTLSERLTCVRNTKKCNGFCLGHNEDNFFYFAKKKKNPVVSLKKKKKIHYELSKTSLIF